MSFSFKWPRFSDEFHADAKQMLNAALNRGNKPPVIADKIEVVELEMGTQPPELEIRDIGELTRDQFRGIFRMSYEGDAHLVLRTKVQANPLNHKRSDIDVMAGSRGSVAAHQPLVVPMNLQLSNFRLLSYVVLVVSRQKGITLVFKTDPLQNVDVNSSFDSIGVIQKYIQKEIEGQLRNMFKEDLPGIIHRLSQRWFSGSSTRVDARYMNKSFKTAHRSTDTSSVAETSISSYTGGQRHDSSADSSLSLSVIPEHQMPEESHTHLPSGLEDFDPTFGLRTNNYPTRTHYEGLGRLWGHNSGLQDLMGRKTYSVNQSIVSGAGASSTSSEDGEYETISAVGGGVVTRPRIFHSQSLQSANMRVRSIGGSSPALQAAFAVPSRTSSFQNPLTNRRIGATSRLSLLSRTQSTRSIVNYELLGTPHASASRLVVSTTNPTSTALKQQTVLSPTLPSSSPEPSQEQMNRNHGRSAFDIDPINQDFNHDISDGFIIRPSINPLVSRLSTLSTSNMTLSPYTRSLEHFTVRSGPPRIEHRDLISQSAERLIVRATRKRIIHLGNKSSVDRSGEQLSTTNTTPPLPSDIDASEIDRYFRNYDDSLRMSPELHPTHIRRRHTDHSDI